MAGFRFTTLRRALVALCVTGCADILGADFNRKAATTDIAPTDPGTASCSGALASCNGDPSDGCEVDLASDPANCGACGAACNEGLVCANGSCLAACPEGLTTCGAACVDLFSSNQHCGACGNKCTARNGATPTCTQGKCEESDASTAGDSGAGADATPDSPSPATCAGGCADGQRCVGGACICDAQSCSTGCCQGTKCVNLTGGKGTWSACGPVGGTCPHCADDEACTAPYPLTAPSVCTAGAKVVKSDTYTGPNPSIQVSCVDVCQGSGLAPACGCFHAMAGVNPDSCYVAFGSSGEITASGVGISSQVNKGSKLSCCCAP